MSLFDFLTHDEPTRIDVVLKKFLNRATPDTIVTNSKELPAFRYPDIHFAIENFVKLCRVKYDIQSSHHEDLSSLFTANAHMVEARKINSTSKSAWLVDHEKEVYFSVERFWLVERNADGKKFILRLKFNDYTQQSIVAVAAIGGDDAAKILTDLIDWSEENSIYRNKILHLTFEAGTKDEYGDVEKHERLRVLFRPDMNVTEKEFITDEEVIGILNRNVVDLHERRDLLRKVNVPVRRGVLLHGPPGTGKTYACRYLCTKLPNTTRIFVTGSALTQVGAIFSLARILQPAVLFLEDVDLIFTSREINLYSTALGDLLDQMDGLRANEDICMVLTTNAIERMEAAIKDRPGRISQCIYVGAPGKKIRKSYLEFFLQSHDVSKLDIDDLVANSKGATQAFLKEWIHRSVQIGSERMRDIDDTLRLKQSDFNKSMDEMTRDLSESSRQIVGFRPV